MHDQKSKQKDRHIRHTHARQVRRSLASITPENSHAQRQCPLFSALPSEIRNLIFTYVVSQQNDHTLPIRGLERPFLHRPGHEYKTRIDLALLQTCRLVYYETNRIPIMSYTHHAYDLPGVSWSLHRRSSLASKITHAYLFHLSSQLGHNIYHLHHTLSNLGSSRGSSPFGWFLKVPHLHWKKITWTVRSSLWLEYFKAHFLNRVSWAKELGRIELPTGCSEVVLELECLADVRNQPHILPDGFVDYKPLLERWAGECKELKLVRRSADKGKKRYDIEEDTAEAEYGSAPPIHEENRATTPAANGQEPTHVEVTQLNPETDPDSYLTYDSLASKTYQWWGTATSAYPYYSEEEARQGLSPVPALYWVKRLVWRPLLQSKLDREYTRYDHLDCGRSELLREMED